MKGKILVILLLTLTLVFSLVACKNKNEIKNPDVGNNPGGDISENPDGDNGEKPDGDNDGNQEDHTHSFGDYTVQREPGCTYEGREVAYCSCGEFIERAISALGHSYTSETVSSTCTASGYTRYSCTKCEYFYDDDRTDATNHSFGDWEVIQSPTCFSYGIESCACHCGFTQSRTTAIVDHNYVLVSSAEPNCFSQGYYIYNCSYNCTNGYTEYYGESGHKTVTTTHEVDCENPGYIEHRCSVCDYYYEEGYTAPIGHSFSQWVTEKEASFESAGNKVRSCGNCKKTENEVIPQIPVRATYSKRDTYDVVRIDRSTPGEVDNYSINDAFTTFEIVGEYVDPSEIEIVYFGDKVTKASFDGGSLREVYFSDDIEYIRQKAFWPNEGLGKIYFEGDAPEIHKQAFNLNGSGKLAIYPSEQSRGFDGFLFGGCEVIRSWITKDKLDMDSLTLKEYAALAAKHTDALALEILSLFELRGQESFLYLPFEPDIDKYKIIKDFAISLTKNCKTEREKIDAIYDWIVANIKYSDPATYYTSYEVFESRSAVCAGYTNLMHDMLCAVGIPSFYTRGTTLFGCGRSVSEIFSHPDDFTTHAWLSVITSDGKVSYYDPTWGASDPAQYKNMTAAQVGEYAITFEISSIQLMVDGVDHHTFKIFDGIQFIVDGAVYTMAFGKVGSQSMAEYYNYWFGFNHIVVTGDHYISEIDQPIGSVYNCGFLADLSLGNTRFCLADGRAIPLYRVTDYLIMQSRYYGESIDYSCDFLVYENGFVFVIDEENNLAKVALYIGDEENVTIPSTVKGIAVDGISQEAFKNNNKVKRLVISEGIRFSYDSSFEGCEMLEYVYIPASFEWEIGQASEYTIFKRCYNLKTVEISKNHPHITSYNGNIYTKDMKTLIFYAPNNGYKIFTLPESVTEIYREAFAYSKLESVILHGGVTRICADAFLHSRIEYIDIPAGCEIGSYAFHYATALRRVSFGDGITEIPFGAFLNCQSLTEVKLPSTITSIGDYAFSGALSLITIDLPEGLKRIGGCAFLDSALVSVTLPSTLEFINYNAFYCCEALFVVNNKSSLELVAGDQSSHGCVAAKVRKLNADPKSYSITVTDNGLVFYADEQEVVLVDFIGCEGDTLILPESFGGRSYSMLAKCFAAFDVIGYVQRWAEIFTWEDYAFHYGQQIKHLVIPASITRIPDYAFEGWSNIEKIYYGGARETWESAAMFDRNPEMSDPEQIPKNDELMTPDVYFFSQNKPSGEGNFWHYVNGVPTPW